MTLSCLMTIRVGNEVDERSEEGRARARISSWPAKAYQGEADCRRLAGRPTCDGKGNAARQGSKQASGRRYAKRIPADRLPHMALGRHALLLHVAVTEIHHGTAPGAPANRRRSSPTGGGMLRYGIRLCVLSAGRRAERDAWPRKGRNRTRLRLRDCAVRACPQHCPSTIIYTL